MIDRRPIASYKKEGSENTSCAELWKSFLASGSIEDYLRFSNARSDAKNRGKGSEV